MNKIIQFLLFTGIFLFLGFAACHAQQNDFQAWPSAEVDIGVFKGFKVQVGEEVRFHENCTQIEKQINDLGVSYKINKYIKADLFYRFEDVWKNPDTHAWKNGFYTDISFSYDIRRLSLGYRMRLQTSKVEFIKEQEDYFRGMINRHKIDLEYNIKKFPLSPFAEGEIFIPVFGGKPHYLTEYRAWLGIKFDINKHNQISLKYGIDQELNAPDPLRAYVVALGYSFDLKLY